MSKPFLFPEFESIQATVQTATQTQDVMMGISNTWATKTAVGASGAIVGSLQSLSGQRQQDLQARFAAVVDYVFFPTNTTTNVLNISNGDRLIISSKKYDVLHVEDETGVSLSQAIYLRKID